MLQPTGPCPARIMIVCEWPSEADERERAPLAGWGGKEFAEVLSLGGINRNACFITWALRTAPLHGDISNLIAVKKKDITAQHILLGDKMVMPQVQAEFARLRQEIELCQPNVIIALGNVSMWMLTGQWGITSWRGSELQLEIQTSLPYKPKVIPTIAPLMLNKQPSFKPAVIHDFKRAARESKTQGINRPKYDFILRPEFSGTLNVLAGLFAEAEKGLLSLAVDIETRLGHIRCIGFAWNKLSAICIPLIHGEHNESYWTEEEEFTIVSAIRDLLTHPNCQCIGQNFHYDAQYIFRHWYFYPNLKYDTMIMQHALFSNMEKSLGFLSSIYCEHHTYWKEEGREGDEEHWAYNCKDCTATFEVCESLLQLTTAMKMQSVVDFQLSLYTPVLVMMERGLRVDTSQRNAVAEELLSEIAARESFIFNAVGRALNPKSPKQMMEFFYEEVKQKVVFSRAEHRPTCNDEALRKIAEREPILQPLVNCISEYRSLGVFFSTFISAPLDADGRMRSSFKITGTDTYRFASSENAFGNGMNLQNIPKGGDTETLHLPNVRKLFIPDPGMTYFDIDLSSADLRIVAWESDEQEMKAMLREGLDPYTEVAKEFYHDQTITKKDPRRQTFKSFCHGTHYLGTAKGLAERLGLSVHEAERTQAWYFERFPGIKKRQDELKNQIFSRRMVENIFGYRFHIFDRIEGTLINEIAAWIPQSTVAILINHALVNIHNNLKEVQVQLQVHDSLAGQFPTQLEDWASKRILEESSIELPYSDPLIIPVGIKLSRESWGGCE